MASIINAGTTSNTALNMSADTSGTLDLQSNGTTMASVTSTGFNIGGAVASGFTMKNRIINGDMVVSQRNGTSSVTPTSDDTYTLDRWIARLTQSSKYSVQQVADAPNEFINSIKITSLSSYSVTSSDYFQIGQYVEGLNAQDLMWGTANAKTVTLSFWVKSSLTGTFGGTIFGYQTGTPSYPFSYTISAANTWEQKTLTITGPTSGTFNTNNSGCFTVLFSFGVGSSLSGTANTWNYSTLYRAPTGATSVVGTNGATFYITGVQLERGSQATSFEWLPYGTKLALCQRYYWEMARGSLGTNGTNSWMGEGGFYSTSQYNLPVMFPVTMRTSPSLNVSNTSAYFKLDTPTGQTFATFAIFQPSIYGTLIYATGLSGGTAGYACSAFTNNASAFCAFSAEL